MIYYASLLPAPVLFLLLEYVHTYYLQPWRWWAGGGCCENKVKVKSNLSERQALEKMALISAGLQ